MVRKENLEFLIGIGIIILVVFGVWWFRIPLVQDGTEILSIEVIYQGNQLNYDGEFVDCPCKTIDGVAIPVLFYNLNFNRTYYIIDGRNQSHIIIEFNEREAFRLWISVHKGDEFFLADENKRDLIWICIRQTEDR